MAWMTCTLFEEFLQTLNAKMAAKNRNILLFIDNCTAHPKNFAHLSNVRVEFFPPNMTSVVHPMDQGVMKVMKHRFWKWLVGRMLQLIKINPGTKNLNNFRLSVLDAMHFLTASWDLISAAVISNCFRKAGFSEAVNEGDEIDNQMEGIYKGAWEMWQDLNFTCSFDDFVEVDDDVLPCGFISIDKLCDGSSEVNDTNETNESVSVPMYCETVKAVETLRQFLQSMSDVRESVMKSVWEIDTFIIGLAQKRTKQMTLDSFFKKQCTDS
jgi:hypothetical protein